MNSKKKHKCLSCGYREMYYDMGYYICPMCGSLQNTRMDEVGGVHEGGVGWNPNGEFCGECASVSCKGCVNEDKKSD
jgi:hypothetical protein